MNTAARIDVKFLVEGFHCWPEAPAHRAYLADKHRHQFVVTVTMDVEHDDREVEFHDVRDAAIGMMTALGEHGDYGRQSCEHIGRQIAGRLAERYGRDVWVHVSEDGECGATVLANKKPATL